MIGPVPRSVVGARDRPVFFPISIFLAPSNFFDPMSCDSASNSTSDSDHLTASGEKQEKKPFVKPELRHEVGMVDGTGTTVSGMSPYEGDEEE